METNKLHGAIYYNIVLLTIVHVLATDYYRLWRQVAVVW